MKLLFAILIFTIGISDCALSQTYELEGEVKDQFQEPVAFASVFLLNVTDSTLVKGTSADENGIFSITNISEGLYFLKASYVGQMSNNLALEIIKDTKIGALIIEQYCF